MRHGGRWKERGEGDKMIDPIYGSASLWEQKNNFQNRPTQIGNQTTMKNGRGRREH